MKYRNLLALGVAPVAILSMFFVFSNTKNLSTSVAPLIGGENKSASPAVGDIGEQRPLAQGPSKINQPRRHRLDRAPAGFTGESVEDEYANAYNNARSGTIAYTVPPAMVAGKAETVTARILGSQMSPAAAQAMAPTGTGTLKLVPYMLVTLAEPANPDAFAIVPGDPPNQAMKFVPDNGFQDWSWTVTPLAGGDAPKKLHITAFMVFKSTLPNGLPIQTQIASYDAEVSVQVKPRMEALGDWLAENWKELLKYILPSGGLTALIIYLIARRSPKKKTDGNDGDDD